MPETQMQEYVNESYWSCQTLRQREGLGAGVVDMFGVRGVSIAISIPIAIVLAENIQDHSYPPLPSPHTTSRRCLFATCTMLLRMPQQLAHLFPPPSLPSQTSCTKEKRYILLVSTGTLPTLKLVPVPVLVVVVCANTPPTRPFPPRSSSSTGARKLIFMLIPRG